jgi:hypothetical protein
MSICITGKLDRSNISDIRDNDGPSHNGDCDKKIDTPKIIKGKS